MAFPKDYLERAKVEPFNDAAGAPYHLRLRKAAPIVGEPYFQVVGIHHLKPEENFGGHYIYFDIINGAQVVRGWWIGWDWEGRRPNQRNNPVMLDKSLNEPGGNIAMGSGHTIKLWAIGWRPDMPQGIISDLVENLNPRYGDEFTPDGKRGNYMNHHSFYVIFRYWPEWLQEGPKPDPKPESPEDGWQETTHLIHKGVGLEIVLTTRINPHLFLDWSEDTNQ